MELLERETPLRALGARLGLAASRRGSVASVAGEAGVGKTSLVEAFAARHEAEARVLRSGCEALGTPRPLGPLHDVARHVRGELARALRTGAGRAELFAVALDELTREAPTILVLEDVHWADAATLDLLKFLGRRVAHTPLLVVTTWRDDEVPPSHPLRITMGEIPVANVERIRLERLSLAAVSSMSRAAGRDGDAVYQVTGGNPFFVTEVLMHEKERVPESVRDALRARVSRLDAGARETIELASIVPGHAERWLLLEAGATNATIDECITGGALLETGGGVMFRHELARMAVEQTLGEARRQHLHGRVLTALESRERDVDAARLAHHAVRSGDESAAVRHLLSAGRHAAAAGAHREAAAHFEKAIERKHLLDAPTTAEVLENLSYQRQLFGWTEAARDDLREALEIRRRTGDLVSEGRDLRWMARITWLLGDMAKAREHLDRAIDVLEALPESAELAMAWSSRSQLAMLSDETEEAMAWGNRAIEVAERLGDREVAAHALTNIGSARMFVDLDRGLSDLNAALALCREHDFHEHTSRGYACLVSNLAIHRMLAPALEAADEGMAYTASLDLDCWTDYVQGWRSFVHLHAGRFAEAEEDARKVLGATEPRATLDRISALTAYGRLLVRTMDGAAGSVIDEAYEISVAVDSAQRIALNVSSIAEAAWLRDDLGSVVDLLKTSFEKACVRRQPQAAGELAYWMWRAGELEEPPDFAALPFVAQIRGDWQRAAREWDALGCRYEKAMALMDGGKDAAAEGLAILEEIEASRVAAVLRGRMGMPRRRGRAQSRRENELGLTTRQMDVLRLVTEGRTNAQIGERLGISAKTVDHHVSAVLAALGASSRTEAAAAAARAGWFHP